MVPVPPWIGALPLLVVKLGKVYNKFEAKHCTCGGPFVGPQNQLVAFIPPSSGPCIRLYKEYCSQSTLKGFFFFFFLSYPYVGGPENSCPMLGTMPTS